MIYCNWTRVRWVRFERYHQDQFDQWFASGQVDGNPGWWSVREPIFVGLRIKTLVCLNLHTWDLATYDWNLKTVGPTKRAPMITELIYSHQNLCIEFRSDIEAWMIDIHHLMLPKEHRGLARHTATLKRARPANTTALIITVFGFLWESTTWTNLHQILAYKFTWTQIRAESARLIVFQVQFPGRWWKLVRPPV